MAIIDSKVANEAEREAQEYARRNDPGSLEWQQPPPAYEETTASAQSASTLTRPSNDVPVQDTDDTPRHTTIAPSQEIESHLQGAHDLDENTPLLTHRQWLQVTRKQRRAIKIRRCLSFTYASSICACIIIVVLQLKGDSSGSRKVFLPDPPVSDGRFIRDAIWSDPFRLSPGLWLNPHTPLMSSKANFTFSAFDELYFRATGAGSGFGGEVVIAGADYVSEKEWEEATGGYTKDTTLIQVEVRYTDVNIRDSIRVSQMVQKSNKGGLGIYGNPDQHKSYELVSFYVYVILPFQHNRSPTGLHSDGSSFVPEIDLQMDNMRLGLEPLYVPIPATGRRGNITLGKPRVAILNAGVDMGKEGKQCRKARDIYLSAPTAKRNIVMGVLQSVVSRPVELSRLRQRPAKQEEA